MKVLIKVHGWIGDTLFSIPIAERLKSEGKADIVDYIIGFPQTKQLLEQNKYIDRVYVSNRIGPMPDNSMDSNGYDIIYTTPVNDYRLPPTIKSQLYCGITTPMLEFNVNTLKEYDIIVLDEYSRSVKPLIGICTDWKSSASKMHNDYPYYHILLDRLKSEYDLVSIGANRLSQYDGASQIERFLYMASLCKRCDFVIGSEGGLTNLASGVGTNVIYTTDFTEWLIGPNGVQFQLTDWIEKSGPRAFFKNANHISIPHDIDYNNLPQIIYDILKQQYDK